MAKTSAGLLMFRRRGDSPEVLLAHPGGPFWAHKDLAIWTIPKGEYDESAEDALQAARREFVEETGFAPGSGHRYLGQVRLKGGKTISAWAFEGDCDPAALVSNTFEMEWPPRSGRKQLFPEVDRAAWFTLDEAREKIHPAQRAFIDRLEAEDGLPSSS